jgi:preprotein translocase subunit SecG
LDFALDIAQIAVAILLMVVVLTQTKGSGFSGAFGGDTSSIYRTRRGIEKTLFNFTIAVSVLFLVLSIVATIIEG